MDQPKQMGGEDLAPTDGGWWPLVKEALAVLLPLFGLFITFLVNPILAQNWLPIGLALALAIALTILWRRERQYRRTSPCGGIVAAWPTRDQLDRTSSLNRDLAKAKRIDMVGFNLRTQFLRKEGEFHKLLRDRLAAEKDLRVRILIADPECESLSLRTWHEVGNENDIMRNAGRVVLSYLKETYFRNGLNASGTVQVRTIDASYLSCSCVFADDMLFLTHYLSTQTGGVCPSMQIRAIKGGVGAAYREDFERLWALGTPLASES